MFRCVPRCKFVLKPLPYSMDALAPHISKETLTYHYGKHHQTYVNKLNELVEKEGKMQKKSLVDIVKSSSGTLFNQAAQVWNHDFYWASLSPKGGGKPSGEIEKKITESFGSFENFQKTFDEVASKHFGSGWVYLVSTPSGKLQIVEGHDAQNPLTADKQNTILACDVWEHAYYIDKRNDRGSYLKSFWNLVNWEFANYNLKNPNSFVPTADK